MARILNADAIYLDASASPIALVIQAIYQLVSNLTLGLSIGGNGHRIVALTFVQVSPGAASAGVASTVTLQNFAGGGGKEINPHALTSTLKGSATLAQSHLGIGVLQIGELDAPNGQQGVVMSSGSSPTLARGCALLLDIG